MRLSGKLPSMAGFVGLSLMLSGCVDLYGDATPYLGEVEERIALTMPANAPSIRQQYRVEDPNSENAAPYKHEGIDVIAKLGTPVLAAAPGRVTKSFVEPMYGNQVVIDHGADASGRRTISIYKHLDRKSVKVGDTVARGQAIGTLGRTGVLAAGILHLHFEIHRQVKPGGRGLIPIDPNRLWMNGVGKITCFDGAVEYDETVFRATYPVVCKGLNPAAVTFPHGTGSLSALKRPTPETATE
ncbi:M23 family metallopeptidase [Oricola sp.]|uniref:M23 family metallopeptidase n=1 Tax=Oricola sp. TaxID=1979950 RepID=UPI0025D6901F|nr:M23 family metallopeptidase [Oricola sp.]MCI5077431.1 M23 family metallopeptidase [Oricola sp.]